MRLELDNPNDLASHFWVGSARQRPKQRLSRDDSLLPGLSISLHCILLCEGRDAGLDQVSQADVPELSCGSGWSRAGAALLMAVRN